MGKILLGLLWGGAVRYGPLASHQILVARSWRIAG